MENTEMFITILGCLIAVFAVLVLYAITLVIKLVGMTTENRGEREVKQDFKQSYSEVEHTKIPVQSFEEDDEEERLVVALAASAMAAKDKPDSHFHISKITRIK